jgi:enhancer of polycomb-like protein
MARNIFPYWKSRREQRKGHRIIPQLNFDETNDGDPYVCFRRRDVKVTRKTRQKDMLVVDRMRNVQVEMLAATKIVALVLEREKEKAKAMRAEKEHWEARWNFMQFKRKNPQNPITPEEEAMLFPERRQPPMAASQQQNNAAGLAASQARKSRGEREREEMQRGQVGGIAPRLPKSRAVSPSTGDRVPPEQLAALYSKRVEEEMRRRKEMDRGWEDSADVSRLPQLVTLGQRSPVDTGTPSILRTGRISSHPASRLPAALSAPPTHRTPIYPPPSRRPTLSHR